MKKIPLKIALLTIPILLSTCLIFVCFRNEENPTQVINSIFKGNYREARNLIETDLKKTPLQHLYMGYCCLLEGDLEESNRSFERFLMRCHSNETLLAETLLALTVSGILENNLEKASSYLQKICLQNSYTSFFDGLIAYRRKNYHEAQLKWAHSLFEKEDFHDGLFSYLFELKFPQEMRDIHLAHCFLETGDYEKARHFLEFYPENSLALAYIGMSYLQEGCEYYQLACHYFDQAAQKKDSLVLSLAAMRIGEVALSHAESETCDFLEIIPLIHTLQKWEQNGWLEKIACSIDSHCLNTELCQLIRINCEPGYFHNSLVQKLLVKMNRSLNDDDLNASFAIWEQVNSLADYANENVSAMTLNAILRAVSTDNANLLDLIQFWLRIAQDELTRTKFIRHLLIQAEQSWNTEGGEIKGMRLMAIVHRFSQSQPEIMQDIETFLVNLFQQAESNNMVERLALIHDALHYFHLDGALLPVMMTDNIPNYLADAEYLFQSQKFASARSHAIWILKLDPDNQAALKLAGLSSFYLGDYTCASFALTKVAEHDESSAKALRLSLLYSSSPSLLECETTEAVLK